MTIIRQITTALIVLLINFKLTAQVKSIGLPDVRNYKRTDYKGGTQNWNIDQDKNGNLYFANNDGLFQFDGSSWTKYVLPNSTSIRSLKTSNSGEIFVGCYNEFGFYKPNHLGKLKYFSLSKTVDPNKIKQIDFIWKIHIYKDEVLFQSFSRTFIYKNNKIKILEAPSRFQFSFLVNNRLFFQDVTQGLLEYSNGKLLKINNSTVFNNTEIWGIFSLPKNQIIIATQDKGLFKFDDQGIAPWNSPANDFVKKNSCLGGALIRSNFIVLNTVLDGIIICDSQGKIMQHINRKKGLQNNTVLCSFIDNKNNLWLGLDNGIAFINESSPFTFFGFSYGISTVYASVVFNNNLYIATNQGVFYRPWNGEFRSESFSLVEGTTGQAWNIQVVNNTLLCAHNRGVMLINNNKSITILDNKGYWGFKSVSNRSNYIIGSNYNGFALFEKNNSGLKYIKQIGGFDKSSNFFEINNNNIWMTKDGLLYHLTLSDDLKTIIKVQNYKQLSNQDKTIESIQKINDKIYFQSNNHFYRYSYEQEIFFKDEQMTNLFKKVPPIRFSLQDNKSNIWYVFNESLGVLMKQENGTYKNIVYPFSNLTGNLVNNYLSINTVDAKNIFIGFTDGLAHFDSSLFNYNQEKPKVFIRSFSCLSDTLVLGNGNKKMKEIHIPYASNEVKFTFSAPIYENLENVEFSYKLDGFDKQWSNWNNINLKEYTNLREGDYEMLLKVRNSYGLQSEVAKLPFTIAPPWYRNWIAYIFYVILAGVAVYIIRQRIKAKIRRNKYFETIEQRRLYLEKEAKIKQEQYELEKEIEKLKNEKLKIKILVKDKELVNNSLQVVKKNKILNGIITKLKEIDAGSFDESIKFQFNKLNKSITKEVNSDKSWKDLEKHIKNVHFEFLKRLKEKYPTISPRELDLSTYLLMNMSTKEIAEIMNISSGGVELARYRLRKKLGLNKKESLTGFLMSI